MEETYDKYLIDHGYPQEIIDMYDIDQKRELYDLGGIYIGGSGVVNNHIEAPINSDVDIPNIVGDYWHFTKKVDPSLSWSSGDSVTISVNVSKDHTKATTSTSKVNFTHSDYIVQ